MADPYNGSVLAKRLHELRLERGLTQQEVGEGARVGQQAVSRWEKGTVAPEPYRVVLLEEFFKLPDGELVELFNQDATMNLMSDLIRSHQTPTSVDWRLDRLHDEVAQLKELLTNLLARLDERAHQE